ncbi:hypothetical protein HDU96_009719 [Phlyctochytrium bullatum]|nr:hypothetical protein HDU96_009719 [Phlyctochytrium bullatum]
MHVGAGRSAHTASALRRLSPAASSRLHSMLPMAEKPLWWSRQSRHFSTPETQQPSPSPSSTERRSPGGASGPRYEETLWTTPFPGNADETLYTSQLPSRAHPSFPSPQEHRRWRVMAFVAASVLGAVTFGFVMLHNEEDGGQTWERSWTGAPVVVVDDEADKDLFKRHPLLKRFNSLGDQPVTLGALLGAKPVTTSATLSAKGASENPSGLASALTDSPGLVLGGSPPEQNEPSPSSDRTSKIMSGKGAPTIVTTQQIDQVRQSLEDLAVWMWGKGAAYSRGSPSFSERSASSSESGLALHRFKELDGLPLRDMSANANSVAAVDFKGNLHYIDFTTPSPIPKAQSILSGYGFCKVSSVQIEPNTVNLKKVPSGTPVPPSKQQETPISRKPRPVFAITTSGKLYRVVPPHSANDGTPEPKSSYLPWWLNPFSLFSSKIVPPQVSKVSLESSGRGLFGSLFGSSPHFTSVAAGRHHVVALSSAGRVYTAAVVDPGSEDALKKVNSFGELGLEGRPAEALADGKLREVPGLNGINVVQIAAGDGFCMARTKDGRVFSWGANTFGQLGTGFTSDIPNSPKPLEVRTLWARMRPMSRPADIRCNYIAAAGNTAAFVVDSEEKSEVLTCGMGLWGQLGQGGFSHMVNYPAPVPALSNLTEYSENLKRSVPVRLVSLAMSPSHCVGILGSVATTSRTSSGDVYGRDALAWGLNDRGQLRRADGKKGNTGTPLWILPVRSAPAPAGSTAAMALEAMVAGGNGNGNQESGTTGFMAALSLGRLQVAGPGYAKRIKGRWLTGLKVEEAFACGDGFTILYPRATDEPNLPQGLSERVPGNVNASMDDSATAFVAVYVRKLLSDPSRRQDLLDKLAHGHPYVIEEEMAIAMIDVSGYSSLTTKLLLIVKFDALGKVSSEVISEAIGDYIGKVSSVVMDFGGDIIKFLGDAILVTFPIWNSKDTVMASQRRARDCCAKILLELSEYEVDLGKWIKSVHTTVPVGQTESIIKKGPRNPSQKGSSKSSAKSTGTGAKSMGTGRRSSSVENSSGSGSSIVAAHNVQQIHKLGLHIGITFGKASHIIVGSTETHLDYFITGDCLSDLETLLEQTTSGELAISSSFNSDLLPVTDDYSTLSSGDLAGAYDENSYIIVNSVNLLRLGIPPRLNANEFAPFYRLNHASHVNVDDDPLLPLFINESMYHRIKRTSAEHDNTAVRTFRPEYRPLSILFVKFLKSPSSEELQEVALIIFDVLREFHGVFQQFTVDDKGCTILAYFGLPPFSTEKFCLHAVQVACAFLLALRNNRSFFAVSVATGESLFTKLGTVRRREAGLLGVVCNTAARLLKISHHENLIAIDNSTYEAIKKDCQCTDLGFQMVKGRTEPLKVWGIEPQLIGGTRQKVETDVEVKDAVIGNREEFAALDRAFRTWLHNEKRKHLLLIEGPSGMGKSSLLSQITEVIQSNNALFCLVRGSEVDQGRPFCVIRRLAIGLISLFYDLQEPVDHDELERSISALISHIKENTVHLPLILEWLMPGRGKKYSQTAAVEAKWDAQRLIIASVAVKMICRILEEKKIVVLLDDFQWLDIVSLEVISSITAASKEILCLVFSRPLTDPKVAEAVRFDEKYLLKGLSIDEIRNFITKTLGLGDVKLSVVEAIQAKTQGSLLQVDTLVSYLRDNPADLEKDLPTIIENVLSKTVEAVIITQFDRLDPFFQAILRCASIIGHYVELTHLLLLLEETDGAGDASPAAVRKAVLECDKFKFLVIEDSTAANFEKISFRHITIRNAIYESQPVSTRQRNHLILAEYYEISVKQEEKKFYLPLMCYHYWRSGRTEKLILKNIEFGLTLAEDGLRFEATQVLTGLFTFIDNECDRDEVRKFLPIELECRALSKLTYCSTLMAPFDVTRSYGLRTVETLLGKPWPRNKKELKMGIAKFFLEILALRIRTMNGRKDSPSRKQDGLDDIRHDCLHDALAAIIIVSVYDGNNKGEVLFYTLMMVYKYGLEKCSSSTDKFFYSMDFCSLMLQRYRWACGLGTTFERKCRKLWPKLTFEQRSNGAVHMTTATAYLLDASYTQSIYNEVYPYWLIRKSSAELLKLQTWVAYPNFFAGCFVDRLPACLDLVTENSLKNPVWTTTLLNVLMYENFFMGNLTSLPKAMGYYEEMLPRLPATALYFAGANPSIPKLMGAIAGIDKYKGISVAAETKALADSLSSAPLATNTTRAMFAAVLLTVGAFVAARRSQANAAASPRMVDIGGPDPDTPLAEVAQSMLQIHRAFSKTTYLLCGKFSYRLTQAAACHLASIAKLKNFRSSSTGEVVHWMKTTLTSAQFKGRFSEGGNLVTVGALFCGIVGLLSKSEGDRRKYSARSAGMFSKMGARHLERWALGTL